jgi:hypothetical protein
MGYVKLTERQFLMQLAVSQFNSQFGKNIDYNKCAIKSIPPSPDFNIAYEIDTLEQLDFVRLRIYLKFDTRTGLQSYKLYSDTTHVYAALGDEVWVALGLVHTDHKTDYGFNWLNRGEDYLIVTESELYVIASEDDKALELENA